MMEEQKEKSIDNIMDNCIEQLKITIDAITGITDLISQMTDQIGKEKNHESQTQQDPTRTQDLLCFGNRQSAIFHLCDQRSISDIQRSVSVCE